MKLTKFFEIVGIVVVSLFVLRLFYIQIEIPVTTIDCDIRITQSNDRAEIDKKNNIYYLPEGGNFNIKVDILYKHIIHNYSWMKDYYPEVQLYNFLLQL